MTVISEFCFGQDFTQICDFLAKKTSRDELKNALCLTPLPSNTWIRFSPLTILFSTQLADTIQDVLQKFFVNPATDTLEINPRLIASHVDFIIEGDESQALIRFLLEKGQSETLTTLLQMQWLEVNSPDTITTLGWYAKRKPKEEFIQFIDELINKLGIPDLVTVIFTDKAILIEVAACQQDGGFKYLLEKVFITSGPKVNFDRVRRDSFALATTTSLLKNDTDTVNYLLDSLSLNEVENIIKISLQHKIGNIVFNFATNKSGPIFIKLINKISAELLAQHLKPQTTAGQTLLDICIERQGGAAVLALLSKVNEHQANAIEQAIYTSKNRPHTVSTLNQYLQIPSLWTQHKGLKQTLRGILAQYMGVTDSERSGPQDNTMDDVVSPVDGGQELRNKNIQLGNGESFRLNLENTTQLTEVNITALREAIWQHGLAFNQPGGLNLDRLCEKLQQLKNAELSFALLTLELSGQTNRGTKEAFPAADFFAAAHSTLNTFSAGKQLIKLVQPNERDKLLQQLRDYAFRPPLRKESRKAKATHKFCHLTGEVSPYSYSENPEKKNLDYYTDERASTRKTSTTLLATHGHTPLFGSSQTTSFQVGFGFNWDLCTTKAMLSRPKVTFSRAWLGNQQDAEKYADDIQAFNYTEKERNKFVAQVNDPTFLVTNEVLAKIPSEASNCVVIRLNQPDSFDTAYKEAINQQAQVQAKLGKTVPIFYHDVMRGIFIPCPPEGLIFRILRRVGQQAKYSATTTATSTTTASASQIGGKRKQVAPGAAGLTGTNPVASVPSASTLNPKQLQQANQRLNLVLAQQQELQQAQKDASASKSTAGLNPAGSNRKRRRTTGTAGAAPAGSGNSRSNNNKAPTATSSTPTTAVTSQPRVTQTTGTLFSTQTPNSVPLSAPASSKTPRPVTEKKSKGPRKRTSDEISKAVVVEKGDDQNGSPSTSADASAATQNQRQQRRTSTRANP